MRLSKLSFEVSRRLDGVEKCGAIAVTQSQVPHAVTADDMLGRVHVLAHPNFNRMAALVWTRTASLGDFGATVGVAR